MEKVAIRDWHSLYTLERLEKAVMIDHMAPLSAPGIGLFGFDRILTFAGLHDFTSLPSSLVYRLSQNSGFDVTLHVGNKHGSNSYQRCDAQETEIQELCR